MNANAKVSFLLRVLFCGMSAKSNESAQSNACGVAILLGSLCDAGRANCNDSDKVAAIKMREAYYIVDVKSIGKSSSPLVCVDEAKSSASFQINSWEGAEACGDPSQADSYENDSHVTSPAEEIIIVPMTSLLTNHRWCQIQMVISCGSAKAKHFGYYGGISKGTEFCFANCNSFSL